MFVVCCVTTVCSSRSESGCGTERTAIDKALLFCVTWASSRPAEPAIPGSVVLASGATVPTPCHYPPQQGRFAGEQRRDPRRWTRGGTWTVLQCRRDGLQQSGSSQGYRSCPVPPAGIQGHHPVLLAADHDGVGIPCLSSRNMKLPGENEGAFNRRMNAGKAAGRVLTLEASLLEKDWKTAKRLFSFKSSPPPRSPPPRHHHPSPGSQYHHISWPRWLPIGNSNPGSRAWADAQLGRAEAHRRPYPARATCAGKDPLTRQH